MKAYIYSPLNAQILLHELQRTAAGMPEVYSRSEIQSHNGCRLGETLHFTHTFSGRSVSINVSHQDGGSLVATLEDATDLHVIRAKWRLGDFLSPVVMRYNALKKGGLEPDNKAMITFEDDRSWMKERGLMAE